MPQTLEYESPRLNPRSRGARLAMLAVLLFVGVQVWLMSDAWLYRPLWQLAIYAGGLAICCLPAVQASLRQVDVFLAPESAKRTLAACLLINALASTALYVTAVSARRQFMPVFHDEFSYLMQARMFAAGHLWMPAHPMGAFFESFYVITDRAYASQYFPGAALTFVPGIWLGLPEWVMPLVIAGATCAAMFVLIRELFGAGAGLASVFILVGVLGFRVMSISPISAMPALLLGTIALFAVLRWDGCRRLGWLVTVGVAIGWLAVTRPLDGAVAGFVIAVFVTTRLRRASWPTWRDVIISGLLPLVPFAALQLSINRGVTGRFFQTPFSYYADRDMPGTALGFHTFDPAARPTSSLPQKQAFFDAQVRNEVRDHTVSNVVLGWPRRRFAEATTQLFPDMLLVIVVPSALLSFGCSRRRFVVALMPTWWLAYTLHVFVFSHYFLFYSASVLVLIFAGFEGIASCLRPRLWNATRAAQVVMPIVISVMAMPQVRRDVQDQWYANAAERTLERAIETLPAGRAIVMVRYGDRASPQEEVVYNVDVAWPDDARVIRAHDLGDDRNIELYRYYAQRQPDRVVYRFDRNDFLSAASAT